MTDCVMWEVRASDGKLTELLAWVDAHAPSDSQIFASEQPHGCRVVVIAADASDLGGVPGDLIVRPAHAWSFSRIARSAP